MVLSGLGWLKLKRALLSFILEIHEKYIAIIEKYYILLSTIVGENDNYSPALLSIWRWMMTTDATSKTNLHYSPRIEEVYRFILVFKKRYPKIKYAKFLHIDIKNMRNQQYSIRLGIM